MKVPISKRLLSCCHLVKTGSRIADVGCDHGYLSIYLVKEGIANSAIAADLREGPLAAAVRNAERFGVTDKIQFYLSDGLLKVPHDFDTLVCAGMGGDTIISILSAAPWLKESSYRLILQCQTKSHLLRKYLSDTGWCIQKEHVLQDGKFVYTVMEVTWEPGHSLTPGQWYFPVKLLSGSKKDILVLYHYIIGGLRAHVSGYGEKAPAWQVQALQELETIERTPEFSWLKEESL